MDSFFLFGVVLSSRNAFAIDLQFWTHFRQMLNAASVVDGLACGAASEGVATKATAEAFMQSHTLATNYWKNSSSAFLNSDGFLDFCEAFSGFGWADGVMQCIFGFISSISCIVRVQGDFSSYAVETRDIIGFDIVDGLGPWEGKKVLDWLLFGSSEHLLQWLSIIVCSRWEGLAVLQASGWHAGLGTLVDPLQEGCFNISIGPVMTHVLSRLRQFYMSWSQEQQSNHPNILANTLKKPPLSLETLMYKFHTDKARDDHKYSDLYGMLFEPIRHHVINIMELGVMAGQSLKVWHEYFTSASVYGIDIFVYYDLATVQADLASFERIHLFQADTQRESSIGALGLHPGSMDVIIDDASHALSSQERSLHVMWRFVRAGGYYIIEDLEWNRAGDRGIYPVIHRPEQLKPKTLEILMQSDAFFVDTTVGHRAFDLWARRVAVFSPGELPQGLETMDRISHSSHVLVIKKRIDPLPPISVQMNVNAMAM